MMSKWQEGYVDSNGIRLHYVRTGGDKAPMVLVHGLTDNALTWTRFANVFSVTYDLVMVDARGHGLSDKPESGYSGLDHARDLAGLIQALSLQNPIVVGHSMGSVTISWLLSEFPELAAAAILEDPVWRWPVLVEQNGSGKRAGYEDWRTRLAARKELSKEESVARGWRERPLWSVEDHDADALAKEQVSLQVLDFILTNEQTWAEQVAKFEVPVLLVYGETERGGIVGPDIAAEAKRINALVEPVQVPGVGHSIRRERFDEYVAVVREFLARVRRG
ncbi:MAG: alpha/beta hydrolase [Caldilineaceae bacterium]|nr:alpha/beta hydrolase [Caldilineaceae bacterium]